MNKAPPFERAGAESDGPPPGARGANAVHETGWLAKVGPFAVLGPKDLETIERACVCRRFSAQEQIIDRDSPNYDVYVVLEGHVRVVNYSVTGREITFDDLTEGGYFGEFAAIDGEPRSASVMAIDDTVIGVVPRRVFLRMLTEHPAAAMQVMQRLARIVRAADERIMDLSTLAAYNRVHAEVLRRARAKMVNENTARLKPIPVHGDIAGRVSTTRETVARAMNDLARNGLVERTKDCLIIHDVQRLEGLVNEVRG